jgi:hypothetical protein
MMYRRPSGAAASSEGRKYGRESQSPRRSAREAGNYRGTLQEGRSEPAGFGRLSLLPQADTSFAGRGLEDQVERGMSGFIRPGDGRADSQVFSVRAGKAGAGKDLAGLHWLMRRSMPQ